MDGRVEFADFAEVLEAAVHLLVGHVGQRPASREVLLFVFLKDGFGVFVEDDGQAVVGLLGGDGHDAFLDVGAADLNDVGVTEAGEGAEAEEVAGDAHAFVLKDGLFVFDAVHVRELDGGAGLRDLKVVELVQLFAGEEDDGLFDGLEGGVVGFGRVDLRVAFADGPAEEPGEVLVLLLDGGFFHLGLRA